MPNKKEQKTCCPKFDPKPWDEKEFVWKDKLFVKDSVRSFMHIPLNLGQVIGKMWKKVQEAKAEPEQFMILSYEGSPWASEQYIPVCKEVEGMENIKLSGTFLTKVFEGPYKEAKNWYTGMQNYAKSKGKEAKKIYFYYTTCPKCAKLHGKNYVVGFVEV